jgi:hypothetical protein
LVVDDDRLDQAMCYLAETDLEFAHSRGMMLRTEYLADVAESMVYSSLTEGSVEDKKRTAKIAPETRKAMEEYFGCVVQFETLKARRAREVLVVELWRSTNANRRVGNLT